MKGERIEEDGEEKNPAGGIVVLEVVFERNVKVARVCGNLLSGSEEKD